MRLKIILECTTSELATKLAEQISQLALFCACFDQPGIEFLLSAIANLLVLGCQAKVADPVVTLSVPVALH